MSKSKSKIFAAALAAFCIGIGFGIFDVLHQDILLSLCLGSLIIALFWKDNLGRFSFLLLGLFCFGLFRYQIALQAYPIPSDDLFNQSVQIQGVVDGEVEDRLGYLQTIIDDIVIKDTTFPAQLLIRLPRTETIKVGDQLSFGCQIQKPEPIGLFRYDLHLRASHIEGICYRVWNLQVDQTDTRVLKQWLFKLKSTVLDKVHQLFPAPHGSFIQGLLFGGSSSLSSEIRQDFNKTGTSHILAASGFNVALFTFVFLNWITRTPLGRRKGILATAILVAIYVVLAGATAAVIRAAIMASLILFAMWVRRKPHMTNIMLLTIAVMLFVNPFLLLFDIGFQLSLIATIAVMTLPSKIDRYVDFLPEQFGIRESMSGSLAAIILTLPIVLWHFGEVSIIAPIVNILVLPLIPILMTFSLIGIGLSFLSSALASIPALVAWALSFLSLWLIRILASLSFARILIPSPRILAIILTIAFLLIWLYKHREKVGQK